MERRLIKQRDKIIKETWEKYKGDLTMKELAEVFNVPLPTLYRIIKKNNNK